MQSAAAFTLMTSPLVITFSSSVTSRFNPVSITPSSNLSFNNNATHLPTSFCNLSLSASKLNAWGPLLLSSRREDGHCVEVLKVFLHPVTATGIQFAVGSLLVLFMWGSNLYKRPKITGAQLPTLWVVSSLVPIVGGVALASMTEASFNWAGFWSAMASNVSNQSRNVLSKKFMIKKEESLDNITLFSIITIMSFFLLAPFVVFMEGVKFTPASMQAAGLNVKQVCTRSLLAALCFHAYQQVSYMILQRVSPVTHSVGNCVKRVVVIVTSVLFFKTPVSPINSIGTGVALAGVFLYSQVKRLLPKPKVA